MALTVLPECLKLGHGQAHVNHAQILTAHRVLPGSWFHVIAKHRDAARANLGAIVTAIDMTTWVEANRPRLKDASTHPRVERPPTHAQHGRRRTRRHPMRCRTRIARSQSFKCRTSAGFCWCHRRPRAWRVHPRRSLAVTSHRPAMVTLVLVSWSHARPSPDQLTASDVAPGRRTVTAANGLPALIVTDQSDRVVELPFGDHCSATIVGPSKQ